MSIARALGIKHGSITGRALPLWRSSASRNVSGHSTPAAAAPEQARGAMSQRLMQMTEDAGVSNPAETGRSLAEPGFDAELRQELQDRIATASVQSTSPQATAYVGLGANADLATRHTAAAQPWTGDEPVRHTPLRMLTDVHKPLRRCSRAGLPPLAMRHPQQASKPTNSTGLRIARAMARSSGYQSSKASTSAERAEFAEQYRARFEPSGRELPATLTGLASLANRRIEEAMALGQFRSIPRGQRLDRDHRADSPFIDTTEYLMNKMIKKQELVPLWIEKQQELVRAIAAFRLRLRADWRRHAARAIAAQGGTLELQMQRARDYATAETEPCTPPTASAQANDADDADSAHAATSPLSPFRDPAWQAVEHSFQTVATTHLNALTRSYNLIAPQVAQRTHLSLPRELAACFRDVAPHLAAEIRQRAMAPVPDRSSSSRRSRGTAGLLGGIVARGPKASVFDEDLGKKGYGFRQFWKDLWAKPG